MAEAEDVITDAARHATIYARDLWRRNRPQSDTPRLVSLTDLANRLDLLVAAALGVSHPLRSAQPPAIPTFLTRLFRRQDAPPNRLPLPATDGHSIWLPSDVQTSDPVLALERFRCLGLLQAIRARRGSAQHVGAIACPRTRAIYLLLEAQASELALLALLPGMRASLQNLRSWCLAQRPSVEALPRGCRGIEHLAQRLLARDLRATVEGVASCPTPKASLAAAPALLDAITAADPSAPPPHTHALFKDYWTGELVSPSGAPTVGEDTGPPDDTDSSDAPRSARMPRRPRERQASEDEDDDKQGVWMVQTNAPLEQAEDPMGMQRPADRDTETPADEFADALSELPEARLVSSPTKPKEVLLSDDPPDRRSLRSARPDDQDAEEMRYPEWDYRKNSYRHPGATIRQLTPQLGPQAWIDKTLAKHRNMLDSIRQRFDLLRSERVWRHRQLDGDEIDLQAYIESVADVRAGLPMHQALYRQQRPQSRDMAITLLIDISGSTDSWLAGNQRIIDIEREALLLVGIALQQTGAPYSIQAFSGEGPKNVTVSPIKSFDEPFSNDIAQRIAALEPQHYTRAGAALRHATALLMKQQAKHRLLILLSDGKPNDVDEYEGRYGVEDMRRAVDEARLQGVFPFCLTIDRQAAKYLPGIFGAHQYALLSKPEALPTVLLEWLRRLATK